MPGRNFEDDNIEFPYPSDTEFCEDDVAYFGIREVQPGGYVGVDEKWQWHFVAWVPLQVNGVVRSLSLHESPDQLKPTYVQSDGGINISSTNRGDEYDWSGKSVAIFVLDEQLDEQHRTATENE